MKIRYSKNAMKFLNKLDKRSVLRIVAGIEGLTLKPPAGDIKVMQGDAGTEGWNNAASGRKLARALPVRRGKRAGDSIGAGYRESWRYL